MGEHDMSDAEWIIVFNWSLFLIGLLIGLMIGGGTSSSRSSGSTRVGGWNGRGDYPWPPGSYRKDRGFCLMYGYQPDGDIADAKPPGDE